MCGGGDGYLISWCNEGKISILLSYSSKKKCFISKRYDRQGQLVEPFLIGICGGSASGKTTVANTIIKKLGVPWVTLLSMDSFYKVLDDEQKVVAHKSKYNFDHPVIYISIN